MSRIYQSASALLFFGLGTLATEELHADDGTVSSSSLEIARQVDEPTILRSEDETDGHFQLSLPDPKGISELVDIKSEFLRSVTLRQLLSKTDSRGALNLFKQAKRIRQPNLRSRLQTAIVQRLATIDPQRSLELALDVSTLNRSRLIETVFHEWSISSLDDAIKAASVLDQGERLIVLRTVFRYRDDLPISALAQIAEGLGHGGKIKELVEDHVKKSAYLDPRSSWQAVREDPWPDSSQIFVFLAIARAWLNAEGREVLFEIADSLENHATRTDLVRRLIDQIAESDPEQAFQYAKDLYEQTNGSIFRNTVREWAKSDPRAALDAVAQLESHSQRLRLQNTIATRWAQNDPSALLKQNLDDLSQTAQTTARSTAIDQIAKTSPQTAKEFLSDLPQDEIEAVAVRIARRWSDANVQEAIDWIKTDPRIIDCRQLLFGVALDELLREDADAAIQFALDHSTKSSKDGLEFRVLSYLVLHNQIEDALEFLPSMREGDGKFAARMDVALNLIVNKDIDRALELSEQVDANSRDFFLISVFDSWAHYDAQGMFQSLGDLSSEDLKRQAAQALRYNNRSLSEDQLKYVRSLL